MRSPGRKGEREWQLLRFPHLRELQLFVAVLTAVYLLLLFLGMTFGVGIRQHIVDCGPGHCAVFDFNPFLWLPIVLLGSPMPSPWWAGALWWLLLATLVARGVSLLARPSIARASSGARHRRRSAKPARRPAA